MHPDVQRELETSNIFVKTLAELNGNKGQIHNPPTDNAVVNADSRELIREEEQESIVVPPSKVTVDPFPVEVLPSPFRRFIELSAAALPCPPDLLAVLAEAQHVASEERLAVQCEDDSDIVWEEYSL